MKRYPNTPHLDFLADVPPARREATLQAAVAENKRTDRYIPWEKLKYDGTPAGVKSDELWAALQFVRKMTAMPTGITTATGVPFTYTPAPCIQAKLHHLDIKIGGLATVKKSLLTKENSKKHLMTSLVEESMASSILEGAAVTRTDAQDILQTGRAPVTKDELMIVNNYKTMQLIKRMTAKHTYLTPQDLLGLQQLITEGTLDDPSQAGRWRTDEDHVRVEEDISQRVVHVPPPASQIPQGMEALCKLANEETIPGGYLHPIVRAILLHFRMSYDHPFVDGNGRTARALFYWSMMKNGFWLCEYLSISREILLSSKSYYRSFLYSEEPPYDLTFFIYDQLQTLEHALYSLENYVAEKQRERAVYQDDLKCRVGLNDRQLDVVNDLCKNPHLHYTVAGYKDKYGVVTQTARTDLRRLVELGLYSSYKRGHAEVFAPVDNVGDVIERLPTGLYYT